MKYRVELDIAFDVEQDAVDLLNFVENLKAKTYKPTGAEKVDCFQRCRYHACSHEEANPTQCSGYVDVDFNAGKQTHLAKAL